MAPSSRERGSRAARKQAVSRGARLEILPVENVDIAGAIQHLRGFRAQAELAKLARLNPSTWSLYESGGRRPSGENLSRVLKALACSRHELEEVVWSFRRRRLATGQGTDRPPSRGRSPASAASPLPRRAEASTREQLPADLEAFRGQAEAILEDLLALLARHRVSGGRR